MDICFACDDNYARYMGVTIYSILKNSSAEDKFTFHVLSANISTERKLELEKLKTVKDFDINYIKMDKSLFDKLHIGLSHVSMETFFRFLIPNVIKADKVLYLDCDIMVLKSLASLFQSDISGFAAAGVADNMNPDYIKKQFKGEIPAGKYINAGVLLINNSFWRDKDYIRQLFDYVKINKPAFSDQDAINFIFRSKIKFLPGEYNAMRGYIEEYGSDYSRKNVVIRHFSMPDKPWFGDCYQPLTEIYKEYMKHTPWSSYCQAPKGNLFWIKMILKYFFIHPSFLFKRKFYDKVRKIGFKATIRY